MKTIDNQRPGNESISVNGYSVQWDNNFFRQQVLVRETWHESETEAGSDLKPGLTLLQTRLSMLRALVKQLEGPD